jgi:ubiquinol-cytochrome c reductase subunit 7
MDADVAEALRRLPDEVVFARNARLRRAMDLSLKHEKLPKELRERQTPFEEYLTVRQIIETVAWMTSCRDQPLDSTC